MNRSASEPGGLWEVCRRQQSQLRANLANFRRSSSGFTRAMDEQQAIADRLPALLPHRSALKVGASEIVGLSKGFESRALQKGTSQQLLAEDVAASLRNTAQSESGMPPCLLHTERQDPETDLPYTEPVCRTRSASLPAVAAQLSGSQDDTVCAEVAAPQPPVGMLPGGRELGSRTSPAFAEVLKRSAAHRQQLDRRMTPSKEEAAVPKCASAPSEAMTPQSDVDRIADSHESAESTADELPPAFQQALRRSGVHRRKLSQQLQLGASPSKMSGSLQSVASASTVSPQSAPSKMSPRSELRRASGSAADQGSTPTSFGESGAPSPNSCCSADSIQERSGIERALSERAKARAAAGLSTIRRTRAKSVQDNLGQDQQGRQIWEPELMDSPAMRAERVRTRTAAGMASEQLARSKSVQDKLGEDYKGRDIWPPDLMDSVVIRSERAKTRTASGLSSERPPRPTPVQDNVDQDHQGRSFLQPDLTDSIDSGWDFDQPSLVFFKNRAAASSPREQLTHSKKVQDHLDQDQKEPHTQLPRFTAFLEAGWDSDDAAPAVLSKTRAAGESAIGSLTRPAGESAIERLTRPKSVQDNQGQDFQGRSIWQADLAEEGEVKPEAFNDTDEDSSGMSSGSSSRRDAWVRFSEKILEVHGNDDSCIRSSGNGKKHARSWAESVQDKTALQKIPESLPPARHRGEQLSARSDRSVSSSCSYGSRANGTHAALEGSGASWTCANSTPNSKGVAVEIASALESRARLKQVKDSLERRFERRRRCYGERHPKTLKMAFALGTVHVGRGQLREAADVFTHVLEACIEVYGPLHPNTLRTKANLATVLKDLNRFKEAEPLAWQTWAGRRKVFGIHHPDTMRSTFGLCRFLRENGRHDEAMIVAGATARGCTRQWGEEHRLSRRASMELQDIMSEAGVDTKQLLPRRRQQRTTTV